MGFWKAILCLYWEEGTRARSSWGIRFVQRKMVMEMTVIVVIVILYSW